VSCGCGSRSSIAYPFSQAKARRSLVWQQASRIRS
jgi:hypothetical protein